ncbi:hypothetical protein ACU686_09055 [Yinghuangia aomiensis]
MGCPGREILAGSAACPLRRNRGTARRGQPGAALRFEIYAGSPAAELLAASPSTTCTAEEIRAHPHRDRSEAFGGRGLGGKPGAGGAGRGADARASACCRTGPFIRGWIREHPRYADLVPMEHREKFELQAVRQSRRNLAAVLPRPRWAAATAPSDAVRMPSDQGGLGGVAVLC